ncbi:MAG: hypothetical protein GTN82_14085 [Candidatus Aminicenantes bacterium]|nr:hypothetical protein [Candidatus Aminicenantes bacterium]
MTDFCQEKNRKLRQLIKSYHLVEYRKQRMQEKGANRKTFVAPSTINRELGILRNMFRLASAIEGARYFIPWFWMIFLE